MSQEPSVNELLGMPEPKPEPIYWLCRWVTGAQLAGIPDFRCLDGKKVEVSSCREGAWYLSERTVASCDSHFVRCNADGTPLAEPLTQTRDTSETSGVEPKPDATLKVGDWVELRSKLGDGCCDPRTLQLSKLTWPRQITTIGYDGHLVKVLGYDQWCKLQRFRRAPPPTEQAEIDEKWNPVMERDEARLQLVRVARERDGFCHDIEVSAKAYADLSIAHGKELAQAREQLADVTKVLIDSLNITEVGNEFVPPCVDAPAMILPQAVKTAIDTLKLSVEKHELDAEEANKTLAKVQAEAAAMRKNVHEVVKEFRKLEAMEGNEPIRCSRIHFGDWADRLLEPTAGRELLDEMRRKDERIAELEKRSAEWETWYLDMQDRAKRKSRTAKAALSEARERVSELESQIRDGVMKAYDAADKEFTAKQWADEPQPMWQYRWREKYGILYRGCHSFGVFQKLSSGSWDRSVTYFNWQACCDDPDTYPCDEHGERIDEPRSDATRIAELERQLAEQPPLVDAASELREMLQGTVVRNGGSKGVDWTVIDGKSIASTIIKLRDAKGGDECA